MTPAGGSSAPDIGSDRPSWGLGAAGRCGRSRTARGALPLAVLLGVAAPLHAAGRDVESRVEALLAQMTLEEKLGQLQQLDGSADGRFRPEHLDLARRGLLGSTLNVRSAVRVNEGQRAAVAGSRLKIPLLFGYDVIHGYRTVFPIPLGEAASWDPSSAERSAAIAAAEAKAAGVHWTFAPMRSCWWRGRPEA